MKYRNLFAAMCLAAASAYGAAPKPRTTLATAHPSFASRGTNGGHAANGPQESTTQADKTWTNDRLEQLHARGLLSEFNQLPDPRARAAREAAPEANIMVVAIDRLQDPRWYAEKASALGTKIQALELELARYREELRDVGAHRTMEAGLAYYQDTVGITPEAGIEVRRMLLRNVRSQLDELSDLARRNNILPGVVRE